MQGKPGLTGIKGETGHQGPSVSNERSIDFKYIVIEEEQTVEEPVWCLWSGRLTCRASVTLNNKVIVCCRGLKKFYNSTVCLAIDSRFKWEELAWVRHSSTWEEYLDKFKCLEAKCCEKTLEKSGARTYGTKSPSRSEALRFIDSAKSPPTKIDG